MSVKKNKNGTYLVTVYYPVEVRTLLQATTSRFRKIVHTEKEANALFEQISKKIQEAIDEQDASALEQNGEITLQQFVDDVWWDMYINGNSGKMLQVPGVETQENAKIIFRLHIFPIFGQFTLNYLNMHKTFVMQELSKLSRTYANIKIVKGYINQVFDVAEMLDYIDHNNLTTVIAHIAAPKKHALKMNRERTQTESLSLNELIEWLRAVETDFSNHKLTLQDYVLFQLTLNIGDRKSESYALQWKHIHFDEGYISLVQSLSSHSNVKSTKAHKKSKIAIPKDLITLLQRWKNQQAKELASINIKQDANQFIFTYTNQKGEFNQKLHPDYLNYRLKSIRHRHPKLAPLNPHKLRHTYATIARQGGASMEQISSALTHSDISTTRIYVNTDDIVPIETHDHFDKMLNLGKFDKKPPKVNGQ